MQLFTIGLWDLELDGSRKRDGSGNFIPTYNNGDITEMARVFTGFWFGCHRWGNGGNEDNDFTVPMDMWVEKHDFGAKSLLGSLSIPARPLSAANGPLVLMRLEIKSLRLEPLAFTVIGSGPTVVAVASNGLAANAETAARLNAATMAGRCGIFFIFGDCWLTWVEEEDSAGNQ